MHEIGATLQVGFFCNERVLRGVNIKSHISSACLNDFKIWLSTGACSI